MSFDEYFDAIDKATDWRTARQIGREASGDLTLSEEARNAIDCYSIDRSWDLGAPIHN